MKIIYKNYLAAAHHAYLQILKLLFYMWQSFKSLRFCLTLFVLLWP